MASSDSIIIKFAFETPTEGLRDIDDWNVLDYRIFLYRGKSYTNYLDALYDIPRKRFNEACLIVYINNIFVNKISVKEPSVMFTLLEECRRERDSYVTKSLKEAHSYFNE